MINNKHFLALDYDKVLDILESFVACPDAKELARTLQPETSLKAAERLLQETLDAHMLLAKYCSRWARPCVLFGGSRTGILPAKGSKRLCLRTFMQ